MQSFRIRIFSRSIVLVIFTSFAFMLCSHPAESEESIKILVVPFEARTRTDGPDVGRGIASLLASKLGKVQSFNVSVLENNPAARSSSARAMESALDSARAQDADLVFVGAVREFQLLINHQNVGRSAISAARSFGSVPYGGAVAGLLGSMSANIPDRGKVRALVEMNVIDVATGNSVLTASGSGESKKSAATLWDHRQNFGDFTSSSFAATAAGEAANAAIDAASSQFETAESKIIDRVNSFKVRGTICDIDEPYVCVNLPKSDGYKVGDKLAVDRPINSLAKHKPRVGEGFSTPVGELVLSDLGEHSSLARFVGKESGSLQVGDYLRNVSTENVSYAASPVPTEVHGSVRGNVLTPKHADPFESNEPAQTRPSMRSTVSTPSSEIWKHYRDQGIKYYNEGRMSTAQSMFMTALRHHPPAEAFNEISRYLNDINNKSRDPGF